MANIIQQLQPIRLATNSNKILLIIAAILVGGGFAILVGAISDATPHPSAMMAVSNNCLLRDLTLDRCVDGRVEALSK